jgi:hypothetical protein
VVMKKHLKKFQLHVFGLRFQVIVVANAINNNLLKNNVQGGGGIKTD